MCGGVNNENMLVEEQTGSNDLASIKDRLNDIEMTDGPEIEMQTRGFQAEILEYAKKQNVIVCLPTGAGKTYIAYKLVNHMLGNAKSDGKKIVFVADTVPLVNQQAKYFSKLLVNTSQKDDNTIRAITGQLNVDNWEVEIWKKVVSSYDIFVMSTQILLDALRKGFLYWNQIALLILDECHHAQQLTKGNRESGHCMSELMKDYSELKRKGNLDIPKILGLTATIINGVPNLNKIESDIKYLEDLFCANAVTTVKYEEELAKTATSCTAEFLPYTLYGIPSYMQSVFADIDCSIRLLKNFLPSRLSKDQHNQLEDMYDFTTSTDDKFYDKKRSITSILWSILEQLVQLYAELGPYCCKMAAVVKYISLSRWGQKFNNLTTFEGDLRLIDGDQGKSNPLTLIQLLISSTQTALVNFIKGLDKQMDAEYQSKNNSVDVAAIDVEVFKVKNCVSDKIKKLCQILESRNPKRNAENGEVKDDLCGLIFCKKRITAQVLRWYLEKAASADPDKLGFLKPDLIMGSHAYGSVELCKYTAKLQEDVIERFHAKKLNILLATQVVEEGIDVPACDLVVRFDPIETYPSYVQSFGRARKRGAKCYALYEISTEKEEMEKITTFDRCSAMLPQALRMRALHVGEDINEDCNPVPNIDPICPFYLKNGAKLTAADAVNLVYRYFNSFSCDNIAAVLPLTLMDSKVETNTNTKLFQASVYLPPSSPLDNAVIQGDWMPTKKLAKRSAFLKIAVSLYEHGEINDNLLIKAKSIQNFKCAFLEEFQKEFEEEKSTAVGKIGSKRRAQNYSKLISKSIENSRIFPEELVSIYNIKISLKKYLGLESVRKLYEFERFNLSYGIITQANLNVIPSFALHANYGSFSVSINKVAIEAFSNEQIKNLCSFQKYLEDSVYEINCISTNMDENSSILIAPLLTSQATGITIDWNLIKELIAQGQDCLHYKPNEAEQMQNKFDASKYENALMVPWYKDTVGRHKLYYAANVLPELNASSPFENSNWKSFQAYYQGRYNVSIFHTDSPLLECKGTGKNLNFLTTKYDKESSKKMKQRPTIKMVPELMNKHALPASLHVQGRLLPSILHRIFRLLLAEELRESVGLRFNWDIEQDHTEAFGFDDWENEGDVLECRMSQSTHQNGQSTNKDTNRSERFILDLANPLEIRWDVVSKLKCGEKKNVQRKKYNLPEPPAQRSNIDFYDTEQIPKYQFDKETDFSSNKGPNSYSVMEALTLSKAFDNISLERFEVIGDSVLKLVASLHIFRAFSKWDEGKMTQMRTKLISNQHLYQIGSKHKIGQLLRGGIFKPEETNSIPPGYSVDIMSPHPDVTDGQDASPSKKRKISSDHCISDKSVADCVEALIGSYYMSSGLDGAFRIMEWLGMKGPLYDGSATCYSRESIMSPVNTNITEDKIGNQMFIPLLESLEKVLKYKFNNPWLAVEALTHPTFMDNRFTPSYERLEFVGDAILDFLVTNHILFNTDIKDPGKITDLRAALVNNVTFAALAVRYGFQTYLKYDSETLGMKIEQFRRYQVTNGHVVSDPYQILTDFETPTANEVDVPKVLGDIFESIAGAVFVDSGMSIDKVWEIFFPLLNHEFKLFSKNVPKNPLRLLYEKFPNAVKFDTLNEEQKLDPKNQFFASKFQVVFLTLKNFKSPIRGIGNTIKQAKQAAAKYVVKKLNI